VLDYVAITIDGKEYLIREDALKVSTKQYKTKLLYITGVTEQGLFWKDIRRILFSKARVRVLCRLSSDGLSDSWMPVKLVDVLSEIAPDMANTIHTLGSTTLQTMRDEYAGAGQSSTKQSGALILYGARLAIESGVTLTEDDNKAINKIATEHVKNMTTVIDSRKGFDAIGQYFVERFGDKTATDPEVLVAMREQIRQETTEDSVIQHTKKETNPRKTKENLIDVEVVAIYW
jgi:hypothetical protein